MWADRQTLAWVSGIVFGRDVVPEVKRINASSAPDAKSSLLMGRVAGPVMLSNPGPGRIDRSKTGMPSLRATARLAELMSERVTSAAIRKFNEITSPLVRGEAWIKGRTYRTSRNR